MLFDTHAHLTFKAFNKDRDETIQRAKGKLEGVVEIGIDANTNDKTLTLCQEHPGFIWPSLGLHPTNATQEEFEAVKKQINEPAEGMPAPKAIGEIGLDYHHCKEPAERKLHADTFRSMLEIAHDVSLPAILHSRDAEAECLDILKSHEGTVIMHCFSGTVEQAKESLDRGYWISIPTTVCFSAQKQELVKSLPLESILLETDCPFLSPIRRTRNEPANVEMAAKEISKILNTSFEQVSSVTTKNAKEAFNL